MPRFFEISDKFTKLGCACVAIVNLFLIFLTMFHIKRIVGTYKLMVTLFAFMEIAFSVWELITHPFVHNFNRGWIFFSLNSYLAKYKEFLQIALAVYAAFVVLIDSFIAVQFVFRYYTLFNTNIANKFNGRGAIIWISYPIICASIYGLAIYFCGYPDDCSDEYTSEEILKKYDLAIKELPRFSSIAYFNSYSVANRNLQRQFFRALVVQTIVPTILFACPALSVLLSPLLDIKMNYETGWTYAAFSLYPTIDSIAFMLLVSEYRAVTKYLFKQIFPDKSSRKSEAYSTAA